MDTVRQREKEEGGKQKTFQLAVPDRDIRQNTERDGEEGRDSSNQWVGIRM